MSKKMGQSLLRTLMPTTTFAAQQMMKAGGGGVGGFFNSVGKIAKAWGSPMRGMKNYLGGQQLGMGSGGKLGWESSKITKDLMGIRSTRRATLSTIGILGAANLFVGDSGFPGFVKNTTTTAAIVAGGAMAKGPLWRWSKGGGGLRRFGTRGLAAGGAGLWAGGQLGVF